jgi:hypothetical protein
VGGTSGSMVGLSIANQFVKTGGWGVGSALSFWVLIVFLTIYLTISYLLRSTKLIPKEIGRAESATLNSSRKVDRRDSAIEEAEKMENYCE